MHRRDFLRTAAAGTALAALPGWLAGCFQSVVKQGDLGPDLDAARRRAASAGKPLLVLVIPKADEGRHERGTLFGGLLNHGGDEALADLALAEVACGTTDDVGRALGHVADGEPLALLVETGTAAREVVGVAPALPAPWSAAHGDVGGLDRRARERFDGLAKAIRAALLPDRAALERRAAECARALPAAELERIRAASPRSLRDVDRGAAVLRLAAEEAPATRAAGIAALAAAARRRLVDASPRGARWAQSSGCGVEIEGEPEDHGIDCGMGFVPDVSRRFLWFYAGA
jgi:hypothetical protein